MAVERASGFRAPLLSAEEPSAPQPRVNATVRGVPVRDSDVYLRDAFPTLDIDRGDILPVDPDDGQTTEEQTPVETYLAWLNRLGQLARSDNPDLEGMLTLADDYGIPRRTALQDIFDALGISEAAQEDPQLNDWMSMLLRNGDDLDLDTLSNVLDMMRTMADPDRKPKGAAKKFQDRILAEVDALKNQMSAVLQRLDTMEQRQNDGFAAAQAQVAAVSQQITAWQTYTIALQGLQQGVQSALTGDGLDADDLAEIAVSMQNVCAPGEAVNVVSTAEWQAAIAGITDVRDITDAQAIIAAGQIAGELLARESAGVLSIEPAVRDDILQAQADGQAAAAQSDVSTIPTEPAPATAV